MSYRPQALALFLPTGCVFLPLFLLYQAYGPKPLSASPKLNRVFLPARHAYSHSASVGRRTALPVFLDRALQNSTASFHDTCSTGLVRPENLLGFFPITAAYLEGRTLHASMLFSPPFLKISLRP